MSHQLAVFLAIITLAINIILGAMIFLRGFKNPAARVFFITVVAIIAWSTTNFAFLLPISKSIAFFLSKSSFFSGAIIALSFLCFAIIFPKNTRDVSQKIKIFIFSVGLFFSALCYTNFIVSDYIAEPDPWALRDWTMVAGPLHFIYGIYFLFFMAAAFFVLIRKLTQQLSGIQKQQIRYIIVGAVLSTIGGSGTNLVIPMFTGDSSMGIFGPYFTIFFVGFTTYAILRHRFLDIRIVLRKGTVYAVTIAIVLGVYGYLVFLISQTTSNIFKIGGDITSVAIIILIALGFHPLRKIVEHTLNEYIFPKRVDLRAAAKRITLQLSSSITEIEKVIKTIRDEAKPALNTESIDLFFQKEPGIWDAVQAVSNTKISIDPKDPLFQRLSQKANIIVAEELEYQINDAANPNEIKSLQEIRKILLSYGAAAVAPIIQHPDTLIGILFLGPKANQSAYTIEDVQFLKNLQQNLSLSMGGIILYYQAMKRVHDQIKK